MWKQLWDMGKDFFTSLLADKLVLGKYLRKAAQPPAGPAGAAPEQPELQRKFAGLGFSDEAAVAMVLADLTVHEAREIAIFYHGLEHWNREHFEAVLSTIPTVAERAQQLKQLAQVPRANMRAVAAAFQFIKSEPDLVDQGREWLRQNLPQLGPQLQQQLQNWTAGLTNRTAAIQARRQGRQQAHAAGQQFAWDPQTQHANMNPIRRLIRIITGL